jgi:hypothetical protein
MEFSIKINVPDTMTSEELERMGVLCIVADVATTVWLVEVSGPRNMAFAEFHQDRLEAGLEMGAFEGDEGRKAFAALHDKADEAAHDAHFIAKALRGAAFQLLHPAGLTEAEKDARNHAAHEEYHTEMLKHLTITKGEAT